MRSFHRFRLPLLLLVVGFGLVVASLCCGSVEMSIGDVVAALFGGETSETKRAIVLDYRLPRLLTALTVGAGLGLCGLITQTLFENPLADPSLFGIHAGAAVGAAAAPLIWSSAALLFLRFLPPFAGTLFGVAVALCGALLVLALIVQLARRSLHGTALLVAGVMISFVLSSVLALMAYFSTTDGLRSFQLWTMGDFSSVGQTRLPFFVAALVLPIAYVWRQTAALDAWLLGEEYARTLGIDPRRSRPRLLFAVGWITACSTAFCGPVAFVGLAAPHAARLLCGTSLHRHILPVTLAVGALLALTCQLLCALPWPTGTLPINAVTPLIGAPIVFLLLMRRPSQ